MPPVQDKSEGELIKEKERLELQRKEKERKENARKQAQLIKFNEIEDKRKTIDLIHLIVLCTGLAFQFLQDFMIDIDNRVVPPLSDFMRLFNSCAIAPCIYFVYKHYSFKLAEMKLRKEAYHKTQLFRSSLLRPMILEMIVNCIHSPPGILLFYDQDYNGAPVTYTVDTIISIVGLTKLYIVLRVFQNYTQWADKRATRICQINGFTPDFFFAIKCYNKSSPTLFLMVGFGFSIVLFGFAVQNFER